MPQQENETLERLAQRWSIFCSVNKIPMRYADALWNLLTTMYELPYRGYHSLEWHIAHMLEDLDDFRRKYPEFTDKWEEIEWAIWWHDAYMVPGSDMNEYHSDHLSSNLAKVHTSLDSAVSSRCIWATTHCLNDTYGPGTFRQINSKEAELMCDLDLLGFVAEENQFIACQWRIRVEYPEVSDEDYKAGRKAFMRKLLDRGYIFLLPEFKHLEELAKERIQGIIDGKYDR